MLSLQYICANFIHINEHSASVLQRIQTKSQWNLLLYPVFFFKPYIVFLSFSWEREIHSVLRRGKQYGDIGTREKVLTFYSQHGIEQRFWGLNYCGWQMLKLTAEVHRVLDSLPLCYTKIRKQNIYELNSASPFFPSWKWQFSVWWYV